jgi:hypothetical protein
MTKYRSHVLSSLVAGALAIAPACGDDEKDDDHGEQALDGDCKTISDACHHADEGAGEAHDCHDLAHDNDTAVCSAELEACEMACAEHAADH